MNKKLKIIFTVLSLVLVLSSVNLYADNKEYYKLSSEEVQNIDFDNIELKYSLRYQVGMFDVYSYNDTHDILVYDDDSNQVYAIENVNNNIVTYPANGEKLRLFFLETDKTSHGRGWGYIDQNNNIVTEPIYELGDNMFGGVGCVGKFDANGDPVYGLVDEQGKLLTDLKYANIDRFMIPNSYIVPASSRYTFNSFKSDYLKNYKPVKYAAFYEPNPLGEATAFIDYQRLHKYPRPFKGYVAKAGIIDNTGKEIMPAIFKDVRVSENNIFAVSKSNGWGYINTEGEVLLPLQYDLVTRFRNGKAAIIMDDELAIIDEKFNILQAFEKADYWYDLFYIGDVDAIMMAYDKSIQTPCSKWATEYVLLADSIGIIGNNLKTKYHANITRKEFCELLMTAIYRNTLNEKMDRSYIQVQRINEAESKLNVNPFVDINNNLVNLAYYMGIVKGTDGNHFNPQGEITRQEAAVMLLRAYKICYYQPNDKELKNLEGYSEKGLARDFKDSKNIAEWAKEGVEKAFDKHLMNGVGNKMFDPLGKYTVEQAIITIIRLYEKI